MRFLASCYPHSVRMSPNRGHQQCLPTLSTTPRLPLRWAGSKSQFGPQAGPEHIEMCANGEGDE